jgi:hypothetical protein
MKQSTRDKLTLLTRDARQFGRLGPADKIAMAGTCYLEGLDYGSEDDQFFLSSHFVRFMKRLSCLSYLVIFWVKLPI